MQEQAQPLSRIKGAPGLGNLSVTLNDLTPVEQAQLSQQLLTHYSSWKQQRSQLEAVWKECWDAYLGRVSGSQEDTLSDLDTDRSQINRPVLFEAVETIQSNLLNTLFPNNEKFFTVVPQKTTETQQARAIENRLSSILEASQFTDNYALFLKQAIITGNTAAAVVWEEETYQRVEHRMVELLGQPITTEKVLVEETGFSGPLLNVIDMADFYIDPEASTFNEAMVMHRMDRTLSELNDAGLYDNLTTLQQRQQVVDNKTTASPMRLGGQSKKVTSPKEITSIQQERYSLLEVWGDFVINGKLYKNYVCTVSESGVLLRFESNPYECGKKPFIFTTFIPLPNQLYGLGAIQQSLGLQHTINTLTNQKLDVINLSINNPFTYLINDDIFDPETVVSKPGALIPVKSHDTLRPVQYLNNYTVAFQEIADLKSEIQEATGALKYFSGSSNSLEGLNNRTATEVSALVQGGRQKFNSLLSHLEHTSLEPYLTLAFEFLKQFSGNLTACEAEPLLPVELKTARCRFKVSGSRAMNLRNKEIESIAAFIKVLQGLPPEVTAQVNLLALVKQLYRHLGFTDEASVFRDETLDPRQVEPDTE